MSSFSKNKTLFETLRLRERRKYIFSPFDKLRTGRDAKTAEEEKNIFL